MEALTLEQCERLDFEERIHKRKDQCWELYTKDGNPYGNSTIPLWVWNKVKSLCTHAAVRLLGTKDGPLDAPLRKYDYVLSQPSCIRFCINPAHLTVERKGWVEPPPRVKLAPSPQPKPPPPQKDLEGRIIGPSPVYVQNTAVRIMLDENKEKQDRPKVNRPGFAGKHKYHG